jgi:hypothetical protein
MRKLTFTAILIGLVAFLFSAVQLIPVAAGDGIPDNCKYTRGTYYQPNGFPWYIYSCQPERRALHPQWLLDYSDFTENLDHWSIYAVAMYTKLKRAPKLSSV